MASGLDSLIHKGSNGLPNNECDACKYQDKTIGAVTFCSECSEYLCDACTTAHRGLKATRNHNLLSGGQVPDTRPVVSRVHSVMFCESHTTMTLELYCNNHEVVVCRSCELTEHKACNTVDVRVHADNAESEDEFVKVSDRLMKLKQRYENLNKKRNEEKALLATQVDGCLAEVRKFRKTINDILDALERNIRQDIENTKQKIVKEIEEHVTIIRDALDHVQKNADMMAECQSTSNKNVLYVGMKKAVPCIAKYERVISNIEEDLKLNVTFIPDHTVEHTLKGLQSLGTITKEQGRPSRNSIVNVKDAKCQPMDVSSPTVKSCTFMPAGHVVLACSDDKVKVLNTDFHLQSTLPLPAVDVAAISDTEVVVTRGKRGGHKQIHRLLVLPNIIEISRLKTNRYCFGIDYAANKIFVTCHDDPGNCEIQVLSMDGQLTKRIQLNNDRFQVPGRVKLNPSGDTLFVSDEKKHKVVCLDQQGQVKYDYTDRGLKSPVGMYVDEGGNVMVSAIGGIHVVGADGRKRKVLEGKGMFKDAVCVSYRHGDGLMVVGLYDRDRALVKVDTTG